MQKDNNTVFINVASFQLLEHLHNDAVDLFVTTCGIQNCFPGHFFGPGQRDEYILHFICGGKGIFEVNGKTYHLRGGDFFLICPNTEVHYEADKDQPWDYIWVGFSGIKAAAYLNYAGLDQKHVIGQYSNTSYMLSYIQQMILARSGNPSNELKRTAALQQILAALIEEYSLFSAETEDSVNTQQNYLDYALAYMDEHLSEQIHINDIANRIGIDRSYLTNIFKRTLGLSPQEYLLQYRMNRACTLLQKPDLKISAIARAVGYENALSFSKIFRKYKGMSPSSYRLEVLGQ